MEEDGAQQQDFDFVDQPAELADPNGELDSLPLISFEVPPYRSYHFYQQFRTASNPNNFFKGVKWSPDGTRFLTSAEDNTLRSFTLPDYGYVCSSEETEDSFAADLVLKEGSPYMIIVGILTCLPQVGILFSDPATCVFATTTRDHPIHLWDASSGQLRCTYRAYDNMDEITAAVSMAFNPAGTKIYAGYNKSLRVFDLHRPGRDSKQHSTLQRDKEGQSGIISSIAFSPSCTGMFATGSYSQTTGLYREDNMELLYVLHGQEGGVTHVQFSKDGNYLYSGGRKDPYILCWDIRKTVETVFKLYRSTEHTNQRILFDIDPSGRHLGTGGEDGVVHIYDLQTGQWVSSFQAALDTVNSFAFHPYFPMAVTSSGQRRFQTFDDNEDDVNLTGEENCASVWSFSYASIASDTPSTNNGEASYSLH